MPFAEELPPGLELAWGLPTKPNRLGRKPTQTVEQIVDAALDLADTDGFAALSMPKLAQRLGLTANAIYRYVRSREELLVLLSDAAWGPPPTLLTDADGGWRVAAGAWTQAMVARCDVHPWLCDLPIRGAPMTPNLLGWTEAILKALTAAGLTPTESLSCALLLDGYARRIAAARRDLQDSKSTPTQPGALTRFLEPRLQELGYSTLAALMAGNQYTSEIADTDVTFGLNRILDGIEALATTEQPTN